jgi:hypothetical protein
VLGDRLNFVGASRRKRHLSTCCCHILGDALTNPSPGASDHCDLVLQRKAVKEVLHFVSPDIQLLFKAQD